MANTKKGFNFRNGLQVDDDNVVINSLGAVGIGSTAPLEMLVVGENAKIHGNLVVEGTITNANSTLESSFNNLSLSRLNIGVTSISDGIIEATSPSGIVTYYGDARYLQGMPTSQWVDTDVGLGYTSIYAAGNVGVGTIDPRFVFQVSGNTDTSKEGFTGVGIQSGGHILAAGIVTAYEFSGFGTGITNIPNASLDNTTVSYGGVSLALGESDDTPAFDLQHATNYPYDSLTGVTTTISADTTPKLGGNLDLNSHDILGIGSVGIGTTNVLDGFIFQVAGEGENLEDGFENGVGIDDRGNIWATGIVTAYEFSGFGTGITNIPNASLVNASMNFGGVTVSLGGENTTPAFDLTNATNYSYDSLTGVTTTISADTTPQLGGNLDLNSNDINGTGNITVDGDIGCNGLSTSSTLKVGIDADGTLGSMLNVSATSIGIGSYGTPNATVHIRRPSSTATLQLTGNSNGASIALGSTESVTGYNGQIIYAPSDGSNSQNIDGHVNNALSIRNYSPGNFNFHIDAAFPENRDFGVNVGFGTTGAVTSIGNSITGIIETGESGTITVGQYIKPIAGLVDINTKVTSIGDDPDTGVGFSTVYLSKDLLDTTTDTQFEFGTEINPVGNFNWTRGLAYQNLMTLTSDGKLGLGVPNPDNTLDVSGDASITSLTVVSDATVNGNLTVNSDGSLTTVHDLTVEGELTIDNATELFGDTITGITTVESTNIKTEFIGFGTGSSPDEEHRRGGLESATPYKFISNYNTPASSVHINAAGSVGIGTSISNPAARSINAVESEASFARIGIGTYQPKCGVDFSDANTVGSGYLGYMIPPVVQTVTERNALVNRDTGSTPPPFGAMVYNLATHCLEIYVGENTGNGQSAGWKKVTLTAADSN